MLKAFIVQPIRAYRDFQIVFTVLTLNFAIPTVSYAFFPDVAMANFAQLNTMLGGATYAVSENASHFWRYLGTANVATLAFMCLLLQLDIERFGAVVVPLGFLKATAATLWLFGWLQHPEYPVFGAAAALDYLTTGVFFLFVGKARRAIESQPGATLIPRPMWS